MILFTFLFDESHSINSISLQHDNLIDAYEHVMFILGEHFVRDYLVSINISH